MAKRLSNVIQRLLDSAQAVEDAITVQGPLVAPILDEMFAEEFAALGERPNFLATLFALRDRLAASRRALAAAEKRHIVVERKIAGLVEERQDLFEVLRDDYTWLRGNLEKLTGALNTDVLAGFQAPTAQGSTKLLHQVRSAVDALSEPGLELPPVRFGAIEADPVKAAAALGSRAEEYAEVRRRLRAARRRAEKTRIGKNRRVASHRELFVPLCQTVEGLFRLAGEPELADAIRPSLRHRGRRMVDLEEAADAPAGEGEAAASGEDGSEEAEE